MGASSQYSYKQIVASGKTINFNEQKIDSILSQFPKKDSIYAEVAHNFSFYLYKHKKRYDLAIKYGIQEVNILNTLEIFNNKYTNALYNLGRFYYENGDYNTSIAYYEKAINTNVFPLKIAQSYCQTGECYFRKGDFYKSIDYYLKGLPVLEKIAPKVAIVAQYCRLSDNCNKMDSDYATTLGLKYLKKGDSIIKQNPEKIHSSFVYAVNNGLANLYALKHQYNFNKARYYYKKNLKKALAQNDSITLSYTFLNIGELYLNKKNDSCLYFLSQSLSYDSINKINQKETHRNIARYFNVKNKFEKALEHVDRSIALNLKLLKNQTLQNLDEYQIINSRDKRSTISALQLKSRILLNAYNQTKNIAFLQEILKNIDFANRYISVVLKSNIEINTQFLWREEISEIFSVGILAAYYLNDDDAIFRYSENNKAFLLTQSIKKNNETLNLPKHIVKNDIDFRKKIHELENKTNINSNKLKNELFSLKVSYEKFQDSIKKSYPNSFLKKNNIEAITLQETKKELDQHAIITSYHMDVEHTNTLIGLLISNQNNYSFKIDLTPEFTKTLNNYKKLISKPLTQKKELQRFSETSNKLYHYLFPTDEIKTLIKNKDLIIITEGILQNIPFESLNIKSDSLQYLVENHNISYAYSASFLNFNQNIKRKISKELIAFAPIHFSNKNLQSLTSSEQELNQINSNLKADLFTNKNATKYNFLNHSNNYKIIHLATHAKSSNTPEVYFAKDTLKLHELYTHKTNADLVVLSACETNLGELKKGEGILNMARGFFYSGANSVISSLWNVNDSSTTYLMQEFYKHLNKGVSKTKAISIAKREYLKTHSLSEKSPYYWASFILIGDTSPSFSNIKYLPYLVAFISLFLITLFFYKKRG